DAADNGPVDGNASASAGVAGLGGLSRRPGELGTHGVGVGDDGSHVVVVSHQRYGHVVFEAIGVGFAEGEPFGVGEVEVAVVGGDGKEYVAVTQAIQVGGFGRPAVARADAGEAVDYDDEEVDSGIR